MTAEWKCTACSATNRVLVAPQDVEVQDRCYHCKTRHVVARAERPPFWSARAA